MARRAAKVSGATSARVRSRPLLLAARKGPAERILERFDLGKDRKLFFRVGPGRLDGHNQLPKLILGVKFTDGLEVAAKPVSRQPATAAA
jgi:hypothetical protein